jgi:hypothetical protein
MDFDTLHGFPYEGSPPLTGKSIIGQGFDADRGFPLGLQLHTREIGVLYTSWLSNGKK